MKSLDAKVKYRSNACQKPDLIHAYFQIMFTF